MAMIRRIRGSSFWIAQFKVVDDAGVKRTVTRSTKVPVDPKSAKNENGRSARQLADEAMARAEAWEAVAKKGMSERQSRKVVLELSKRFSGNNVEIPTLKAWMEKRINDYSREDISPSSIQNYKSTSKLFMEFLGKNREAVTIDRITKFDADSFRNWMLGNLSISTCNLKLTLIKRFFRDAVTLGFIDEMPFESVKHVKQRPDRVAQKRPFTHDELKLLLKSCDDEWRSMVLVSLYTGGQRLGDIACLPWECVDFKDRLIRFRTQKRGKFLNVPMIPALYSLLKDRRKIVSGDYIHPRMAVDYVSSRRSRLCKEFGELLCVAGLLPESVPCKDGRRRNRRELSFHSLRYTSTTLLHAAGVPAAIVQEIVGHDNKEIHERYIKFGEDSIREALGKLPKL